MSDKSTAPTNCPSCGDAEQLYRFTALEPGFSVFECADCGMGRTWPPVPDSEIGSFYPVEYYGKNNVRFNPPSRIRSSTSPIRTPLCDARTNCWSPVDCSSSPCPTSTAGRRIFSTGSGSISMFHASIGTSDRVRAESLRLAAETILKHEAARSVLPSKHPIQVAANVLLLPILLPLSIALTVFDAGIRSGGTMEITR